MNELINKLAKELPDQYTIEIRVERGYGGVVLICPDGAVLDDDYSDGESVEEQALRLFEYAIKDHKLCGEL